MATYIKKYTVTISTGATGLSNAIALEGATPFAIQMSTGWTAASITFQGSADESTYQNMFTSTGGEVTITSPAASRYIVFTNPEQFQGLQGIKLRSGISTAAQAQAAARTLVLFTRGL